MLCLASVEKEKNVFIEDFFSLIDRLPPGQVVNLAVDRRHEIRPRRHVVLERVPHVGPLPDVGGVGRDRRQRSLHRGQSGGDAGKVVFAVLLQLVCG